MSIKTIMVAVLAFLSISLLGETTEIDVNSIFNDNVKPRYVPLSRTQWQHIQSQINSNGWCCIEEQNVILAITNGYPNIERYMFSFPPPKIDLERNPLRTTGKRGREKKHDDRKEPMPYQGQRL